MRPHTTAHERPDARRPGKADHVHTCLRSAAPGTGRAARHAARRPRRGRTQHDDLRVRRQDPHRRLRRALPRGAPARRRPDPARSRTDPGSARGCRRRRAHARTRGPHRRRAVPAAAAPGHPPHRIGADARADAGEAEGAPDQAGVAEGDGERADHGRPVRSRVHRRQPFDSGCAGRRDPHTRRTGAAHGRLQDGPAAAGRADHRPAGVRAARRGGRRPLPARLHERRRAGLHSYGAGDRCRARPGHLEDDRPRHRRELLEPRAPRAAGARRGGGERASRGAARAQHGAQHDDRRRPRLPERAAGRARGLQEGARHPRSPDRVHVDGIAG